MEQKVAVVPGASRGIGKAVIAWLATHPEAVSMSGQTIHAQPFCKQRQLVPGWPEAGKDEVLSK